jgi:hypothetical protein
MVPNRSRYDRGALKMPVGHGFFFSKREEGGGICTNMICLNCRKNNARGGEGIIYEYDMNESVEKQRPNKHNAHGAKNTFHYGRPSITRKTEFRLSGFKWISRKTGNDGTAGAIQ